MEVHLKESNFGYLLERTTAKKSTIGVKTRQSTYLQAAPGAHVAECILTKRGVLDEDALTGRNDRDSEQDRGEGDEDGGGEEAIHLAKCCKVVGIEMWPCQNV